jgi:hypothetical protein
MGDSIWGIVRRFSLFQYAVRGTPQWPFSTTGG